MKSSSAQPHLTGRVGKWEDHLITTAMMLPRRSISFLNESCMYIDNGF